MLTSNATTRTATVGRVPAKRPGYLLELLGRLVQSPETGLDYRVERWLGEGGFGQVYLAKRLGRSTVVPQTVCIKISGRIDGWLREAYFGRPDGLRAPSAFSTCFRCFSRAGGNAGCCTAWCSNSRRTAT